MYCTGRFFSFYARRIFLSFERLIFIFIFVFCSELLILIFYKQSFCFYSRVFFVCVLFSALLAERLGFAVASQSRYFICVTVFIIRESAFDYILKTVKTTVFQLCFPCLSFFVFASSFFIFVFQKIEVRGFSCLLPDIYFALFFLDGRFYSFGALNFICGLYLFVACIFYKKRIL